MIKNQCPLFQPAPTAELDRSEDTVYQCVMDVVKVVVEFKNDLNALPSNEYITAVKVMITGKACF